jgi:hypothetical protein
MKKRKINKKTIISNGNLCCSVDFIIIGDFNVINKFSFSIVRPFMAQRGASEEEENL